MKKIHFLVFLIAIAATVVGQAPAEKRSSINPFFRVYKTPFESPPFDLIREEHYMPAFLQGMSRQRTEVKLITRSGIPATFANTVERLDYSGNLLARVNDVFYNLLDAHTSDGLQRIALEVAPLLAKHNDDILLNPELFARIREVYENGDKLGLATEQSTLLEKKYKEFVRGGALLDAPAKTRLRQINEEVSVLTIQFAEHVLKDTNAFQLIIDKKEDLAGLPQPQVEAAAAKAKEAGSEGRWLFTLHAPSIWPFLQYAENRELRQKIWKAYASRGDNGNETDNKKILSRIASLRLERAKLLGYPTHADYVLEESMAKNPGNVQKLLHELWAPSLERARAEAADLQAMIASKGEEFKLEPWDWRYYAERVKMAKYNLDDEVLRPYFKLENVRDGAFEVAGRLFGLRFKQRKDIPVYHPDVQAFEVLGADGAHVGILFLDYYARPSKRGGAWMSNYRDQYIFRGQPVTPIVVNCQNFTPPGKDGLCLLTTDEVEALFHEFGHALHGLLSNCIYRSLSGTRVPRDFVELPSQIMQNWAGEPEVMKIYGRHYQTGKTIPDELIAATKKARLFNQGFATVEYLAASFLDMDWHTLTQPSDVDPDKFENESMARIGLIPEIISRYRSTYFNHIFGDGYSAGYYSYIWSEVLDADAFEAFKEKGIFDAATAKSFLENVLSRGNTEEPMVLYKRFRGREPSVEPLLKRRGFLPESGQ